MKKILMAIANSRGLTTSYSGLTKTLFVKGENASEFVKRYTPDKTGNVRNERGHFIKGGLGFTVAAN